MLFPVIDAHQHFWKYNPERDRWITDEMQILRNDYLPSDLEILLNKNGVEGTLLIQSEATENGNLSLLKIAGGYSFIKGLVAWIDPRSANLGERLSYYQQFRQIKGFRFLLQDEKQRDLMLNKEFQTGIGLFNSFGFSFDLLIRPDQLVFAEKLARLFPNQRFVIDHLAKPFIRDKKITEWERVLSSFSTCENVFCKISGIFTEANWNRWSAKDFHPYLDIAVRVFGMNRIMFGSDWPVCLVAAEYADGLDLAKNYFKSFTLTEQTNFFYANAERFYQLTQ